MFRFILPAQLNGPELSEQINEAVLRRGPRCWSCLHRRLYVSGALSLSVTARCQYSVRVRLYFGGPCLRLAPLFPSRGQRRRASEIGGLLVLVNTSRYQLSAAMKFCPETATKLPAGGHETCPVAVMGSARHDVVCLTGSDGLRPLLRCDRRC